MRDKKGRFVKGNEEGFKKGHKAIIGTEKTRFKKGELTNEKHPNWKGDKVGYHALHKWIYNHKPKSMFCEKCGKITDILDASSINHTYERDISKWRWLCKRCHKKEDFPDGRWGINA
jgi:hypothetical protein